jgi:hypothetical protein
LAVGGSALVRATEKIVSKAKKIAAHLLEASEGDIELKNGKFSVAGTDKSVDWAGVTLAAYVPHNYPLENLEPGLEETAFYDPSNFTFPAGCYICEVEVDPETGKTEVISALNHSLDLEGHANHRGSSFGKRATGQPEQIDFENALAIDLLKRRAAGQQQFVLEDEARLIGRCSLPLPLYQAMQQHPLVWLEDSVANRVERILQAYVVELCAEFVAVQGAEAGFTAFAARLRESLANITRRLGGERYQRLAAIMEYDFDNGQDRDRLAREALGRDLYLSNKKRMGLWN